MAVLITGAEVGGWVGNPAANPEDLDLVARVASEGVAQIIGAATPPENVQKLAALTIASDLWERRSAPNGVRAFGPDGTAVRVSVDGWRAGRAVLAPWLTPGVA